MTIIGMIVAAVVVVAVAVLLVWLLDRCFQRVFLYLAADRDPEGLRAAGQAWVSIAGDAPPTMRVRSRRGTAEITAQGTLSPTPHEDETAAKGRRAKLKQFSADSHPTSSEAPAN